MASVTQFEEPEANDQEPLLMRGGGTPEAERERERDGKRGGVTGSL